MRVVVVSDLHANLEALASLLDREQFDALWVLGDLVNYGPNPVEVVDLVRARASLVISGNHDRSVAYNEDPRCSPRFRRMAEETGRYTASMLSESHRQFLRSLPLTAEREIDGTRFLLCHATPSDPLYEYCRPDSERWPAEARNANADVLLVGHTHLPFQSQFGSRTVLNPGSLGQPKHGRPEACYAVWDGSSIELRSLPYPFETTISRIRDLPLAPDTLRDLGTVLRTGGPPGP